MVLIQKSPIIGNVSMIDRLPVLRYSTTLHGITLSPRGLVNDTLSGSVRIDPGRGVIY